MVKTIYSAGVVPYRQSDNMREYLLLQYHGGYWDLPKGKLEPGETKLEAALRELQEETGIVNIELESAFEDMISYGFYDHNRNKVEKTVYFFLGYLAKSDTPIILSEEHRGYVWLDYDQALHRLTYANAKNVLSKIEQFLSQR